MNACSWACAEVTTVLLLCGSQELKSDHQDCLQAHLLTDLSPQPINLFFKKKKKTLDTGFKKQKHSCCSLLNFINLPLFSK